MTINCRLTAPHMDIITTEWMDGWSLYQLFKIFIIKYLQSSILLYFIFIHLHQDQQDDSLV